MQNSPRTLFLLLALVSALAGGCGDSSPTEPTREEAAREPRGSAAAAIPADAPRVVFVGDSISAGLHLSSDEAFPAVLQRELADEGLPFHLVNAGVSGDTTAGGRSRIDWLLSQEPDVVVVELGGNDGLRGVSLPSIEENLLAILAAVEAAGAVPVLLGMRIPTNYDAYGRDFDAIYPRVAEQADVAFVPFFMQDVAEDLDLFLPDGIHPTAEGHRLLARRVAPILAEALRDLPYFARETAGSAPER